MYTFVHLYVTLLFYVIIVCILNEIISTLRVRKNTSCCFEMPCVCELNMGDRSSSVE